MTSDFNKEGTCCCSARSPVDDYGSLRSLFLGDSSSRGQLHSKLKLSHFRKVQGVASFSLELCFSCWFYFWDLGRNVTKSVDWNVICTHGLCLYYQSLSWKAGKDPQFGMVTHAKHRIHPAECQEQCPRPLFYLVKLQLTPQTHLQKGFPDLSPPLELITPVCWVLCTQLCLSVFLQTCLPY